MGTPLSATNLQKLVLVQQRDNPITYTSAETTPPNIVGFFDNNYVMQVSYTGGTLVVTSSIAMPCLSTLPAAVTWCTPMFITMMSSTNVPQT